MLIAVWRNKHTKGHLPHSYSGLMKFAGFQCSKTSANKRLIILCMQTFGLRCKGSEIFLIVQKKEYFLLSSCVYSKKIVTLCPKMCINSKNNIL